jgi:protocatechuate 3,4-dioxygenase beta subunit
MRIKLSRRELLEKCMALGVVTSTADLLPSSVAEAWARSEAATRPPTPGTVLGPFYKRLAPNTKVLRQPGDPGMPLVVAGTVFSTRGEALPAATVEVWQTNHLGLYDLDGYRYRTKLTTSADGKYDFSSVMPGHYPARVCQHTHYLVTAPGYKPLITQLYFATDPVFEGDPEKNYKRDPLITSRELVRPITLLGDPQQMHASVQFELVLEPL